MALSSYNCSLVTALLLLLSVRIITSSDQQCDSDDDGCRMYRLHGLFEEALISSNGSLWQLQQYYFNPFSDQNSEVVSISIWVTANSIINDSHQCGSGYLYDENGTKCWCIDDVMYYSTCKCKNAFIYCSEHNTYDSHCKNGQWLFFSNYILQPPGYGPSNLARLMTTMSTTITMFTFDPTFYYIMKALSSSTEAELYHNQANSDTINLDLEMHINTILQENPCIYDAVTVLGTVIAWVSLTCYSE